MSAGSLKRHARQIGLAAPVVEALREQRRWQAEQRDAWRGNWPDSEGYVFTTAEGKRLQQPTVRRWLSKRALGRSAGHADT